MTNAQLAAARRVESQFPNVRILKQGETLIPKRGQATGAPVAVTAAMSSSELERQLRTSCAAING